MRNRALLLCSIALTLAACSEAATLPAIPEARLNGGMTMGGGLAVPTDDQGGETYGDNAAIPPCEETERGGMTMGGGLYTGPVCP